MELSNEQVIYSSEKCVIVRGEYNGHQCIKKTGGFSREAALVIARINSQYIPRIYEIGEDYIIAEYADGVDLSNAKISPKSVRNIAIELCEALEALHKNNVIHRDVKPSNIILCGNGHIKLIDFDAARIKKTTTDKDTVFIGTDGFAPPEQFGFTQTDERSDIYAFGVTIKLLLGKNYARSGYRNVIEKCMRFDPGRRYASIKAVRSALIRSRYLPIAIPCLAVIAAVIVIAIIMCSPAGITSTSSNGIKTESTVASTDSPTLSHPISVPENNAVIWDLLALPKGFPRLADSVQAFDYDEDYFDIYLSGMTDGEFIEIENQLKKWLDISEDSILSEYMDGEKRELSNSNYTVCIYKYHDFTNQKDWRCWISVENREALTECPQLEFSFADPNAAELGDRPISWEDTELNGIVPKLAENVTDAGIQWGNCYYAEWEKMSLDEVGCVLQIVADELNAEITRQHLDGGNVYQWTFRADIDGELKYISVDYNLENQFSMLSDDPQMTISIR